MATREQIRAEFALRMIEEKFEYHVDEDTANFLTGAPSLVLSNGIGQTMAFLASKASGSTKHRILFEIIREWMALEFDGGPMSAVLRKITQLDMAAYLRVQQETLAMLSWLKRYGRAFEVV